MTHDSTTTPRAMGAADAAVVTAITLSATLLAVTGMTVTDVLMLTGGIAVIAVAAVRLTTAARLAPRALQRAGKALLAPPSTEQR
ncbi:hypothetical protein SMD11_0049 [Streptomyces albireticuli]|uniref:Uncharacterized protein n=1 Tax=Streptomyces albireticuli TaxID=1940 RepID=A0A1Z2KUH7_9ACTN|nr:hypothetical protein SMD11_0049 [Streptomyces albireticuli]